MADVARDVQNVIEMFGVGARRVRMREDPYQMYSDREFRIRYRLTKEAVRFITDVIHDDLEPLSINVLNVPPYLQVLVCLRFFAKGCYQTELGDLHGLSQSSVSRIVHRVARAISSKVRDFVKWPDNIDQVRGDFYRKAGLPGVVGCIDCTHIRIRNPDGARPLLYCNRKGFYSLNVQVICTADSRITDIVARWRGSVHDSRIWTNCTVMEELEDGRKTGILLGDSGYRCTPYMLTPVLHPRNASEEAYNRSHKATRVTIECFFGRWKGMFRALQNNMQVSLATAKACISAMAILYNIKLDFDEDFDYDDEHVPEQPPLPDEHPLPIGAVLPVAGNVFRQQFITQHFQR